MGISKRTRGSLYFAALVISTSSLVLGSCAHLPFSRQRERRDQKELYLENIERWNGVASEKSYLKRLYPFLEGKNSLSLGALKSINTLFNLAFMLLAADGTNTSGIKTGPEDGREIEGYGEKIEGNTVKIYFGKDDSQNVPYVNGLLISPDGWVITVQHPFSIAGNTVSNTYAKIPSDDTLYALTLRSTFYDENIILLKFDIPDLGENTGVFFSFALPHKGMDAYLPVEGTERALKISDTGRELSICDGVVFKNNFISRIGNILEKAVSGAPLFDSNGSIVGLYFFENEEKTISGFVGCSNLLRQIQDIIVFYNQMVKRKGN